MMQKPEKLLHDCKRHDLNYPLNKMSCNPNTILCSDCPYTKEELAKRRKEKYGIL